MRGIRSLTSCFRPNRGSQPSGSGTPRVDSQAAQPPSKGGLPTIQPSQSSQSKGPGLQRVDSNPVRLPSNPLPQRPEAKPIQGMMWTPGNDINSPMNFSEEPFRPGKLSRPKPDINPPKTFSESGANPPKTFEKKKIFGIPLPFQSKRAKQAKQAEEQRIMAGAPKKIAHLHMNSLTLHDLETEMNRPGTGFKEIVLKKDPAYDRPGTSDTAKMKSIVTLIDHPGFAARRAELRNEKISVPNGPTATRMMNQDEQVFFTNAFRRLDEDIKNKPFHIHGETAITGTKKGEITQFNHTPSNYSSAKPGKDDAFHLHTHPPFVEPFTSSAAEQDHNIAARFYLTNKTTTYVTNGKDVLHIQPDSLELVKLIPDPKAEKKLGKFPEAFRVPERQRPPYPFTNHEAPATFKKKWEPPAGWKPPVRD